MPGKICSAYVQYAEYQREVIIVTNKLMNTLQALLYAQPAASSSGAAVTIDAIRQSMLDCMGQDARGRFPQIERRVRFASNLEALWFLRPELLMAVSSVSGELIAQGEVERISTMFDGLLPKGMSSHSSKAPR